VGYRLAQPQAVATVPMIDVRAYGPENESNDYSNR
jgi:hypothetical protein